MEVNFMDNVDKRASEWSKEKSTLGKIVKVNVKRPRALLATSTLSTAVLEGRLSSMDDENKSSSISSLEDASYESEEERLRTLLWAARLAIDKGYTAYLNLVELRRLLQSRPSDSSDGTLNYSEEIESRKGELLQDVEENVNKMHFAFGVHKIPQIDSELPSIEIDSKMLARTLSLPKGRMLLSRVIDEGILPHPSACHILPAAIGAILNSALSKDLTMIDSTAAPPAGEDRLLRSLTGLVRTVEPSVDPRNLLTCLNCIIDSKDEVNKRNLSLKTFLTSKRSLLELLHAILSRGNDICLRTSFSAEWSNKETNFLALLSNA
jgi:hypothetical protein